MYSVLVASLDDWNTLAEIPFILKKGGCTVDILCSKNAWLKSNSYYNNWIESKEGADEYTSHLIDLVKNNSYNWVILGDDPLIKLMNESIHDEELFTKILPIKKIENRNILSSKFGLNEVCEKYDILSPKSIICDGNSIDMDIIHNKIAFPVIIKKDFSWGGLGIMVCQDLDALKKQLQNVSTNENLIIQEYIEGEEVPVEALFSEGKLITYNVSKILSYDKDEFSYSTRRIYYENTMVESELTKLGMAVGINGFVNLAYILCRKKIYII